MLPKFMFQSGDLVYVTMSKWTGPAKIAMRWSYEDPDNLTYAICPLEGGDKAMYIVQEKQITPLYHDNENLVAMLPSMNEFN